MIICRCGCFHIPSGVLIIVSHGSFFLHLKAVYRFMIIVISHTKLLSSTKCGQAFGLNHPESNYATVDHAFLHSFSDVVKVLEDGDLQTLGLLDYDKRLKHSFTAHPKVDPFTGIYIKHYVLLSLFLRENWI
jgi:hypothetical protein